MAKEVLAIPEQYLAEVIQVIRCGLDHVEEHALEITPRVMEQLTKWCGEEEAYLELLQRG